MRNIPELVQKQREFFASQATKPLAFRKAQLENFAKMIRDNEDAILEALHQDLNKSRFEAYLTEINPVLSEVQYMLDNIDRLAAPREVGVPVLLQPGESHILREPYGVVLNMSPWNYPINLSLTSVVGALAAGNTVVLKASAYCANTSALMEKMAAEYFAPEYFTVLGGGGRDVNTAVLTEKFDYIFFTGSVKVGHVVMHAAAEHLTPVTLELGGKSPCVVDETANVELAAKRILWGKALNFGQTCISPDYVFVHESVKERFVNAFKTQLTELYGEDPSQNPKYPNIINQRQYERVKAFLDNGNILAGGQFQDETLKISPTLMDGVTWQSPVMEDEIFGSILPLLTYQSLNEVIAQITARPKPLAMYVFTENKANETRLLSEISSGNVTVNDTMLHILNHDLPFGGVGDSGMGGYHGEHSFRTFSHEKGVFTGASWVDLPLRYPPFEDDKVAAIKSVSH
ncbi:aldehyde dehydrogenase (NAD+) [Neisseria perflava]|uniref:aldehyde dehydrogenase family protein n=1 Tax=Neisseria perflava TaxID=33053 RepID=UPI00209DCB4F|nr:aldehyde dehydrogenase family protein [Neisseria perflava]MCP1772667.1 aldehyde dehydrogenase (NAD+) [Neisseria perflava]